MKPCLAIFMGVKYLFCYFEKSDFFCDFEEGEIFFANLKNVKFF